MDMTLFPYINTFNDDHIRGMYIYIHLFKHLSFPSKKTKNLFYFETICYCFLDILLCKRMSDFLFLLKISFRYLADRRPLLQTKYILDFG